MRDERAPAILPIEKFVGQSDFQFLMPSQIADRVNAEPVCFGATHDERIGVVEAEIGRHADAEFFQRGAHRFLGKMLFRFQNFFADRAGVFRVKIDLSAPQCLPEDDGAAHSGTLLHGEAGTLELSFCDLAQNIRFGEFLRTDDDRSCSERGGRGQTEKERKFQNAALLCALMKSVTNAFAGSSRRSAALPRCTMRPSFIRTISSAR